MTLLADSGSTKCDWVVLDNSGAVILQTTTPGLNPTVLSDSAIKSAIQSNSKLQARMEGMTAVEFFGAGCGTDAPKERMRQLIQSLAPKAKVNIYEDILAAVHAVTDAPGIVAILGTGSNSCFFDGAMCHTAMPSLGHALMDEASGFYLGRQLLRDYFYKKMPKTTAKEFASAYDLNPDTIKTALYKKENPNVYLASFAPFIFKTNTENPYFSQLLEEAFSAFTEHHLLCFDNAKTVPVHFVGSIAFHAEKILRRVLVRYGLSPGSIIQKPIDGLVAYYQNKNQRNT